MKRLFHILILVIYFLSFVTQAHAVEDFLCFTAEQDSSHIGFTLSNAESTYFNDFFLISDDALHWHSVNLITDTILLPHIGDKVYFKATQLRTSLMLCRVENGELSAFDAFRFWMDGVIAASGNIMSLIDPSCQQTVVDNAAVGCFSRLFQNCTSLTSAPSLPALELSPYCYFSTFEGCTALKNSPLLNAYRLNTSCCQRMFYGCSSLLQSPTLYAFNLVDKCYKEMFCGCSQLNIIKVHFTTWKDNLEATASWTKGVHFDGYFIAPPQLSYTTGISHIPDFWTKNQYCGNVFRVVALQNCSTSFHVLIGNGTVLPNLKYSLNGGASWQIYQIGTYISMQEGDSLYFAATSLQNYFSDEDNAINLYIRPGNSSSISDISSPLAVVKGNVVYLLDPSASLDTLTSPYCFQHLFESATYSFESIELPATSLSPYCYKNMFTGCPFLSDVPSLNATTLAQGCYEGMFQNCHTLSTIQPLPSVSLAPSCYARMFYGCSTLTVIPQNALPATVLHDACYYMMFAHCQNLTNTPSLPATSLAYACYSSMFEFDTLISQTPALPATILPKRAYENMFANCTNITSTMQLPARRLADSCYLGMFANCKNLRTCQTEILADTAYPYCCYRMFDKCENLTTAPSLLPGVLSEYCYAEMFNKCRKLTKAPFLPAPNLVTGCYYKMFTGCINLNSLEVNFNQWNNDATTDWVNTNPIETYGTFKCPAWLNKVFGVNNIPRNWKVDAQNLVLYDNFDPTPTLQLAQSMGTTIDTIEMLLSPQEQSNFILVCFPFSINANMWNVLSHTSFATTPLFAFTQSILTNDTLNINIEPVNEIIAGKPYVLKCSPNTNSIQWFFANTPIEKSETSANDDVVLEHITFSSTFRPLQKSESTLSNALFFQDGKQKNSIDDLINNESVKAFRVYATLNTNQPVACITIDAQNNLSPINNTHYATKQTTRKLLINNHVYIIKNNTRYDILGNAF